MYSVNIVTYLWSYDTLSWFLLYDILALDHSHIDAYQWLQTGYQGVVFLAQELIPYCYSSCSSSCLFVWCLFDVIWFKTTRRSPNKKKWVSRVLRPALLITGHFRDESLQAITCTGSDNTKQTGENTPKTHKKQTVPGQFLSGAKSFGKNWQLLLPIEVKTGVFGTVYNS